MKALFFLILFLAVSKDLFATPQTADTIILEGKKYIHHDYLMETYFGKYPNKRPKINALSTASHRGYVATFEVKKSFILKRY